MAAAISPDGPPASIIRALLAGTFEGVVCPGLLAEIEDVLSRSKFGKRVMAEELRAYLREVATAATPAADPHEVPRASRDPKDDYLVALAVEAEVDALVSGDADLTSIADPPVPIMTPREFLELLRRTGAIG